MAIVDSDYILENKKSLPNKLIQDDDTITDITGKPVTMSINAYENKPGLPNKFLNPDGSYSTLNEIITSMVDTNLFVIVTELPDKGNEKKIYLVPNGKGTFDEYHYHNSTWDPIGTLDVSNLSTKEDVSDALITAKNYTDEKINESIITVLGGEY